MKQYTFKDGFKCVASSVEEAKSKHKATAKTLSEMEKEWAKATKTYLDKIAKAFKVRVSYDNKVTIKNYTITPLSTRPDLFAIRNVTKENVIHNIFIGTHKEVIEWLKEKLNKKVTAKFSPDEVSRLEKCLELLEKQCEICGLKLYFELDNEKEYVNVYLKPDKKDVYLTVNVGSDSTATAMYEIWKTIYPKI